MLSRGGSYRRVPVSGLKQEPAPVSASDGSSIVFFEEPLRTGTSAVPPAVGSSLPDVKAVTCMCHIGFQRCEDVPLKTDEAEDAY